MLPAVPTYAQGPPGQGPPTPHEHEGNAFVWICAPNLNGVGETCGWINNYGLSHSHGSDDGHEDEGPTILRPSSVSGSCQLRSGTVTCTLSLTPAKGSLKPVRYRAQFLDVSTGRSSRQVVGIEHISPDQLTPEISFSSDATILLVKVQAVGECKREEKRDADAVRCSRHKTRNTKIKVEVAR